MASGFRGLFEPVRLPDLLRDAGELLNPEHATEIASALARLCATVLYGASMRGAIDTRASTHGRLREETFAFLRDVTASAP